MTAHRSSSQLQGVMVNSSAAKHSPCEVLILGGGFAGRSAARALRAPLRRKRCKITLLDGNPFTTMVPLLPDFAAGLIVDRRVCAPLASLLPDGITFHQGVVTHIDLAARWVRTERRAYPYDYLILALGSVASEPTPDSGMHAAHPLTTHADALRIRRAFPEYLHAHPRPHVLISGAGYTGIELAAALRTAARRDDTPCRITLLERSSGLLPFLDDRQQRRVLRSLQRQQIDWKTDCFVETFEAQCALLSSGERYRDVFACRTEGTRAPLLPVGADLAPLPDGRLPVEPDLSLAAWPEVFAVGDSAAFPTRSGCLRKAVNFAIYNGQRGGANIARRLAGRKPRAFRPLDLGWVIPLGDDSVGRAFGGVPLQGRIGLGLHYFMCGLRNYNARNIVYFTGRALSAVAGKGQQRRTRASGRDKEKGK